MAVSVDTVYQRVLAILNKEQRGYITPQEFNLFANQAQLDIFEQYFYDINQFGRLPGNSTEFSDMLNILNEKIALCEVKAELIFDANLEVWNLPASAPSLYRIGTINLKTGKANTSGFVEVERIEFNDSIYILNSPYTQPTSTQPIYVESSSGYHIYTSVDPATSSNFSIDAHYIKEPTPVQWAYQMVYGEALYDATNAVDFVDMHPSEETELVIKILELSGLAIKDIGMYQVANQIEQETLQQEKQ